MSPCVPLPDADVHAVLRRPLGLLRAHPTGEAMMAWVLTARLRWRVQALLVDGFEGLNENAQRRFSTPDEGLDG